MRTPMYCCHSDVIICAYVINEWPLNTQLPSRDVTRDLGSRCHVHIDSMDMIRCKISNSHGGHKDMRGLSSE